MFFNVQFSSSFPMLCAHKGSAKTLFRGGLAGMSSEVINKNAFGIKVHQKLDLKNANMHFN